MENVTGIIVSYNTKDLLKNCYESIRNFYPYLKIIIVDGSLPDNDCCDYVKSLAGRFTEIIRLSENIGHGKGINIGVANCLTEYFLLIDSDIIMNKRSIEKMMHIFTKSKNIYGVGQIVPVDKNGSNMDGGIEYLHPHFCIIKKSLYEKFSLAVHHGAPLLKSMLDLSKQKKIGLIHFPVENYITHLGRGTRKLNPPEFLKNWES